MFVNNCERHIHLVLEMKKTKRSNRPCVYDETRGRSFSLISCRNLPLMVSSEDREAMQFFLPLHSTLHSHAEHFAGCTYTADLTSCDRLSFHGWWVRSSLPAAHKESWSHKLLLLLLPLKLRVFVKMYILWYILFKEAAQVGWFSATVSQTFTLCCFQLYTPQVFLAWRWPLTPRRKLCSFLPDLGRFLGRGAPCSGWGFAPPSIDRWQRPPSSPQPGQVPQRRPRRARLSRDAMPAGQPRIPGAQRVPSPAVVLLNIWVFPLETGWEVWSGETGMEPGFTRNDGKAVAIVRDKAAF